MCYMDPLYNMNRPFVREVTSKHGIFTDSSRSIGRQFPPNGLLTSDKAKHDVELNPHIIEPDPLASDDCLNDFSPIHPFLVNTTYEENMMNPGADELSSGLNGRLRPRKSNIPSPQSTKLVRKSDGKSGQDKVKRTSAASKTPPTTTKTDDLATKSDTTFLCPYCDKNFASKQTLSKHFRRIHGSNSKQDSFISCLFCSHYEAESNDIIRHMVEAHHQQYFACLNCHTRFSASNELAEHKIKSCETKLPYRSRLRQKVSTGSMKETLKDDFGNESKVFSDGGFNGIVISCELKPSQVSDGADIEDNITTNLILPPSKNIGSNTVIEKNAVIVLDDIQWNKRIPPNFSFHNSDADQILSRLGVVHRSPRTGESAKKDWKNLDEITQKFEKCFDTSFYSKVASNVQENLSKFLDGSFNFNPDPDSTIKTRKSKNSVLINTAEGFPILLASEQYSRNAFDRYMPRAIAPKHKWKWDNLESEKIPINPDQIKRDSHTNNCIISLVSSLDIWTQLRMRRKFEEKFGCPPLEKKTEKQNIISNELKEILESRELPTPSTQVAKLVKKPVENVVGAEFPFSLGLAPSTSRLELQPAVLSGEWVRPRCYVCCACGAQNRDSRAVSAHVSTHHPNAQVQHYEIVGEQLLNADIVKHLYVPPSQMCNRTRPPRGFRECTKCKKSITLDDLHQHMLDCAGDTPAVRRKCRYRPFGVRRRRPRLPDNTIRKKIRKDIRTRQTRPKTLMRPRPIRTEVGDAETIRKMIADLPAKRHRVLVNPTNPALRPRIKQRSKILLKRRSSEDRNKRKKRSNKESSETRLASPVNDAMSVNDGMSVKSDDDNKPLKPKIRCAKKTPRRTESDKRKTAILTRAKQLKRQVKKVIKNDNVDDVTKPSCSSKLVITEDLSIENAPQKIDVNAENFKAREHAGQGQGSSNNRDGQRPSSSGQSSNSQNRCTPPQNVPLKHSIARLTADSEKHDKSVQFHHLFLVQQECNNINQHVQSGQQLLFENEAAVLTLDKPPLHYSKGSLDALQKSKLNKPRKGLNACIAMLKNKLVEPYAESAIPAGHVSVQCGDDEPLYVKPDPVVQTPAVMEAKVTVIATPEATHVTRQTKNVPQEADIRRSSDRDIKRTPDKNLKISNSACKVIAPPQKQRSSVGKRESSRRRPANEGKTVQVPPGNEAKVVPAQKSISPEVVPVPVNAPPKKHVKQHNPVSDNSKQRIKAKTADISKKVKNVKPNVEQLTTQQLPVNKPHDTLSKQVPDEKQIIPEPTQPSPINNQITINEIDPSIKERNIYYEECLNLQSQGEYHSDCEYGRKMNAETYPVQGFNHVPVNNRPAHASTHVESIVSIPLDLSGKISNVNTTQDSQNSYLLGSYSTYETLDLSNKNQGLETNDGIVDLSIKTLQLKPTEVEVIGNDDATDLSFKSCTSNDVPTDLTVKKRVTEISSSPFLEKTEIPVILGPQQKREVKSKDKTPESQAENENVNMSSIDVNKQDVNASSIGSLMVKQDEPLIKTNEANTVPTQPESFVTTVPETTPEKYIENNPADLSYQHRTEKISKNISPPVEVSVDHDSCKNQENASYMSLRINETTSLQAQKPVYDPTLKIPQYKIRAHEANANSLVNTTSSATSLVSNNTDVTAMPSEGQLRGSHDQLPAGYGNVPLNTPNTTAEGNYGVTNRALTSHLNKYESTTPVYTLATACISVTKIESSNSTTLTNVLLSIPGSAIANTTPVYTLAGTTIGAQVNYSHIASAVPSNSGKKDESITQGGSGQIKTQYEKEFSTNNDKTNNPNVLLHVDQDPETARKIALLPKELVDVLGNMPVDHRNRLLNILPQYVSTPMSDTSLKCDYSNQSTSSKLTMPPEPKESKTENTGESPREPGTKVISPLGIAQEENKLIHMTNSGKDLNFLNTPTMPPLGHPTKSLHRPTDSDDSANIRQTHRNTKDESQIEMKIKSDVTSEDSLSGLTSNKLSVCHNLSIDKVIDLTEDETVPRNEIQIEPTVEPPSISILPQPKRNKSNNDQTASLRAVRIKAPAARQKSIDNQLGKYTTLPAVVPIKINNNEQDNEVEKSLQSNITSSTDVTLAIQQAEVSSTQHSNKNVVAERKFPSVISPNVQESNLDESNNCSSRRLSTASKDENMKNDDIQNLKSVVKTTFVTSSIVNNEQNKKLPDVVKNDGSSLIDLSGSKSKHDVASESSDLSKDNSTTTTDSNMQNSLDISESYDMPFQCSTPKSKPIITNIQSECLLTLSGSRQQIVTEDQEDSDDDLSLAVIFKQKQQNLLKTDKDGNKSTKEADTMIRRKDRKKKNLETINTCRASSLSNNNTVIAIAPKDKQIGLANIDQRSICSVNEKQTITATTDENLKNNNRKLRRKIIAQTDTCGIIPKESLTECESDNVTGEKNCDIELQIIDNRNDNACYSTVLKDDNKQAINTSRKRSKANDEIATAEMFKDHSLEEHLDASKSKVSVKQKKKKKKTQIEHTNTVDSDIYRVSSNLGQKDDDRNIPSSNQKSIPSDENLSSIEPTISEETCVTESERILDKSPHYKETSNSDITPGVAFVPLTSCTSTEETGNTMTPLRRSKRGRSRNNSITVEETLSIETTLQENRTPLTKKQLIFSKLLLDEENNIKHPDSGTSEKIENLEKTTVIEIIQSDSKSQNPVIDEDIEDQKNKSIKRKKSPHLKRKCKKKKALNTRINPEETNDSFGDQAKDKAVIAQDECKLPEYKEQPSNNLDKHTTSQSTFLTDTKCAQPSDKEKSMFIEKRKSGDLQPMEQLHSSLPKKTKLNSSEIEPDLRNSELVASEDNIEPKKDSLATKHNLSVTNDDSVSSTNRQHNTCEESNKAKTIAEKSIGSKLIENDLRVKTCYNMPVAGRRTRSKSAVIKSAVYDPYDIDMDDMIEDAEPLRQRKTSTDYSSNCMKKLKSSKDTKNMAMNEEDDKKVSLDPPNRTLGSYSKHDMSDSDDSSRSDVPLKKYVEEKEKKICGLNESIPSRKADAENDVGSDIRLENKSSSCIAKKNRRTLGVCNSGDSITEDETEQQLRSEQFMESFGFFSERKPRKSNLLATKKISETFHIIANDPDDKYYSKDRNSKRSAQNENRKSADRESHLRATRQRSPLSKKTIKRGRKKKISTTVTVPSYCHICKKEFRRSDNFLRHQMTLLHVSKMSEVEMKIKTVPVQEEPNYLIAYKEHLDRMKIITDKMLKRKKNSKSTPKIAPLSLEEILNDVNKIVREQQVSHRGLSCDEELFLDCCELLKESHKKPDPVADIPSLVKDSDNICPMQPTNVGLDLLGKTDVDVKCDNKNDGDVDSLTAKTILESEEVRNLENDLISGLKEAANASNLKKSSIVFQHDANEVEADQRRFCDQFSSPGPAESQYDQVTALEESIDLNAIKNKKYPEFKEKMYPDVEEIDMFEDKFDKIKRKCRSQAAAAKQPQLVVEPSISRKGRKKSEKKKGKKSSKKNHPNTVLTKGALKGFDGIKVSIPTSDINISAIVSPLESSHKKKKKSNSKRRRENKVSESSSKYDSDHLPNESSTSQKNVDVYEFMDNEDVELFEFRPSTLMERFKSMSNKDIPSTSKVNPVIEEGDNSSGSASDGDDFVYMSDDYVCSDDETENSLMSCDVINSKITADTKKVSSQIKKRDATEKNAVMGKIFKNNAIRSEKKITKNKEPAKPKANLDQLFDSLLEDEPSSSMLNDETLPLKDDIPYTSNYGNRDASPSRSTELLSKYEHHNKQKYNVSIDKENYSSKYKNLSSDNDDEDDDDADNSFINYGPSTSKLCLKSFMGDHKSAKPGLRPSLSPPELKPVSPKKYDHTSSKKHLLTKKQEIKSTQNDSLECETEQSESGIKKGDLKSFDDRSPVRRLSDGAGISKDYNELGEQHFISDETGVARQRARRKCTVGKQNVLAETWSSESEPDGAPPRSNSAESTASGNTRKKKGKKKDGQHTGGRRTNNRHISFKKQDTEIRVSSSIRNITTHTSVANSSGIVDNRSTSSTLGQFASERNEPGTSTAGTSVGACKFGDEPQATPSTSSGASVPSTSAGASTSTGSAAADQTDPTFLVPPEPVTSGTASKYRNMYHWTDGTPITEEQARQEQLAREEQARKEREAREREEHEREEEAQQQQQQQHGWIVGDSHKKLVTMLAHAKGRKRNNNNDDKRHKAD